MDRGNTKYGTIEDARLLASTASKGGPVDWDEVDEYGERPRQFALCQCLYSIFGMKTASQALFDSRVHLRNLIHSKEQKYDSAELAYTRALNDLAFYKKKKNFASAKKAMGAKKKAEKRMDRVRAEIASFEEKLHALDDMYDSKESTEALKQIGENMKHFNLPKRLRDAENARDTIATNSGDFEELQNVLKPMPVYNDNDGSLESMEEEIRRETEEYFAQSDSEDELVHQHQRKTSYVKASAKDVERFEPETSRIATNPPSRLLVPS